MAGPRDSDSSDEMNNLKMESSLVELLRESASLGLFHGSKALKPFWLSIITAFFDCGQETLLQELTVLLLEYAPSDSVSQVENRNWLILFLHGMGSATLNYRNWLFDNNRDVFIQANLELRRRMEMGITS